MNLVKLSGSILFISVLLISSCNEIMLDKGGIVKEKAYSPNPTTHIFMLPIGKLRDTILSLFEFKEQYENSYLKRIFINNRKIADSTLMMQVFFSVESSSKPIFGKEYFSKPNTANDVYVHAFGETWPSPVYYANAKTLKFRTPFIFKLQAIDSNKTQVTIEDEQPRVINGTSSISAHGPVAKEDAVKATTIEEYTWILFIASKLGDTTLAPLNLPKN